VKLILLLIIFSFAQDSKIQLVSRMDLSDITIGDRITYTLIIEHDKDIQLLNLEPVKIESEHLEISAPEIKRQKGKNIIEYKLVAYKPGSYSIPPVTIRCIDAMGREYSLKSQSLKFRVRKVRPNGAVDIKDIKSPENVPRNITVYLLIFGIIVLGFGIATYLLHFKNRKTPVTIEPETVIRPPLPHEIALRELSEIESMGLVAKGEMKEYYSRVSEVIRRYIERRYGIAALEMTTEVLLEALKAKQHSYNDISKISEFLNACDFVKFAKYQPSTSESRNLLQQARDIVGSN